MPLLLTLALLILGILARRQHRRLQARIEAQDEWIAALTRRVAALEGLQPARLATTSVESERTIGAVPPEETGHPPEPPSTEPAAPVVSVPADEVDWETRVGVNWLNRLGAAILVIGFALFLGYSLTQLGPAGKVFIGLAAGLSLLAGGIAANRFDAYRNYAYSLMGAGWALIFFTAYAAHGVPEARVLDSAAAGALTLLVVTALMIAHSACYRSEMATGLACVLGFIGLNVSPLTEAGVLATLLLAVTLTALSFRFYWTRLPLLGVALTYLTFVLRYDTSIYSRAGLLNGQATLWIYWTAFEVFDLLMLRRSVGGRSLFLLNISGFIGASILHEWNMNATDWSVFFGLASLAYLASSLLRARLRASAEESGCEWAAVASAALMAAALIERFTGVAITTALLVEGQMVMIIGAWLGSAWIQRTGAAILGMSCIRLFAVDMTAPGSARAWTPTGVLMSAAFWTDRWFVPRGWYLSLPAAAVLMSVIDAEAPELWVAPLWAAGGVLAVAFGRAELPWLGLAVGAGAVGRAAILNVDRDVLTTSLVIAGIYSSQLLWLRNPLWMRSVVSSLGTILLTMLIAERVEGRLLTVWLGAEGAALLAAGFVISERPFRLAGLTLFLVCLAKLFLYDLRELDTLSRILSFVVLGVVMMAASWLYTKYREKLRRLL